MISTDNHEHWMSRALELARQAEQLGEVPVGAVVVLEGRIIGEGYNQPVSAADPTAHAEIVALRQAAVRLGNYRLPGVSLYVSIEPCAMCAGAMIHARVQHLFFGATEPRAGAVCSHLQMLDANHLNHRVRHTGGILEQECAALIAGFFRQKRKRASD
ncbi:MAG: tRNA adenosine(34) deaminase TadA [Pseudomonadales bacterium]|nr:tRNA adenosine(34) deaminase TadA [Pseudomonadales bacterium]